jgi:hypothetical protein
MVYTEEMNAIDWDVDVAQSEKGVLFKNTITRHWIGMNILDRREFRDSRLFYSADGGVDHLPLMYILAWISRVHGGSHSFSDREHTVLVCPFFLAWYFIGNPSGLRRI